MTMVATTNPRRRARLLPGALGIGALAALAVPVGVANAALPHSNKPKPSPFASIEKQLQANSHLTFKITYTIHSGSQNTNLVFEQRPPDSRYGSAQGFALTTGGKSYFCSDTGGKSYCVSSGANPFASLAGLFSATTVATELKALQTEVAIKGLGVSYSTFQKTFAGQPSTCVKLNVKSKSYQFCVTNSKGILAYSGSATGYAAMTSYSSSVPSGDFALPKGATIAAG